MFEVQLKTYYKDGRIVDTTASAQHFVEFEEHFDQPIGVLNERVSNLYYLSWLTAQSGLEFKEWLQTVRDVDPVTPEAAAPFAEAASEGE